MSQSIGVLENVDTPDGWAVVDADDIDNEDLKNETVMVHQTGAQIALHEEDDGEALRVYLRTGEVYFFEPDLSDPKSTIERIADKYSIAAKIDSNTSDEDSRFRYYAVINPYCHGPIPFCRDGGDEAVYDEVTKAVIFKEQIQHSYDNQEVRVIQLDRTEFEELQD